MDKYLSGESTFPCVLCSNGQKALMEMGSRLEIFMNKNSTVLYKAK